MAYSIRFGVFETNSSSVHSLICISEEDFMRWKIDGSHINIDTIDGNESDDTVPHRPNDSVSRPNFLSHWEFEKYCADILDGFVGGSREIFSDVFNPENPIAQYKTGYLTFREYASSEQYPDDYLWLEKDISQDGNTIILSTEYDMDIR